MKILVSNDDGIFAPGLEAMVQVLQHFADVYVICPDQERSAVSHSITLRQPIKAMPLDIFPGTKGTWCINGTPVDCVKLGIEVLMKEPPDFVFSGINLGPNLGRDLYYSGTIAGASEAVLYGIPSAAVSLNAFSSQKVNFTKVSQLFYKVAEVLIQNKLPNTAFLNINLPYLSKEQCKGVKVIPLDMTVSRYRYVGLNDPHGHIYYWLKDLMPELDNLDSESDFQLLREGYITISPIEFRTHYKKKQEQIDRWFNKHTFQTFKGVQQL
ncbi:MULTISPECIES: 5'/3'-nucleotidase SurE [Bacillus]|uniref:5'-nucleotidase SurE n=2 Tax=Bacillus TaxID=1386 RepID=A0A0M4FE05_9BACI|nr:MULTISPECIES: 5'/3'-nucleotidase SurE [Bacillus]ALC80287.1 stationary phase survival protein SurE [Bacillus gobiensis]MBP1083880.1 5'-nucleotidase [Bacillus capparidis]MED1098361.1 5'/3'-nucleotidase SurE [Bacillus capparidis]